MRQTDLTNRKRRSGKWDFTPIVATLAASTAPKKNRQESTVYKIKAFPDIVNEEKICEISDKNNIQKIIKNLSRQVNRCQGAPAVRPI